MFARKPFFRMFGAALAAFATFVALGTYAQTAVPRLLSGPTVSEISETTATIHWTTDVESTTVVDYGTTEALGKHYKKIVPLEESEVTERAHSMALWELPPGTEIFYRVQSTTEGGTYQSPINSFTTKQKAVTCTADEWSCGDWATCKPEGSQTRSCALKTDCPGVETPKPDETRSCTPACTEDRVTCGEWGACSAVGMQKRDCKVVTCEGGKHVTPETTRSCTPPAAPEKREPAPEPPKTETEKPAVAPVVVTTSAPAEPPQEPQDVPAQEPSAVENAPTPTGGSHDGLTPEEKQRVDELIGSKTVIETFDALGGDASRYISVRADKDGLVRWWKSLPSPDGSTAPGVIIFDTDHDGLPDDMEKRLGTDPAKPDITDPSGAPSATVPRTVLKSFFEKGDKPQELIVFDKDKDGKVDTLADRNQMALRSYDPAKAYLIGDTTIYAGAKTAANEKRDELKKFFETGDIPTEDMFVYDPKGDGHPMAKVSRQVLKSFFETGDKPTSQQLGSLIDSTLDLTFLRGEPIGQPIGSGETDPSFSLKLGAANGGVERPGSGDDQPGASSKWGTFIGHAAPNTTVLIYIYSYVPMVLTATTDANGDFTYDLSDSVVDGTHTAYVAVADDTGVVTKKSSALALIVRGAVAATAPDEVLPQQEAVVTPAAVETNMTRWFLLGALAVIVVSLIALLCIMRARKQLRKDAGPVPK